jgi:NAD(P)-dependent dehydrogenase (short-subunit alcohol dehydrogenase family)
MREDPAMAPPEPPAASPEPTTRVVLVTGANTGIGLATCRALACLGCTVLLGARNRERGEAAVTLLRDEGLDVRLQLIDVTDIGSVQAAAQDIDATHGRLDTLVNNAAVKTEFHPASPSATPLQVVRDTYETNVFGTIAVIQAMLPLLRRSSAGRIVNLSSSLGSIARATDLTSRYSQITLLGYSTSKTAINAITVQFANELRDTPIKVNAVDPGQVATPMNPHAGTPPDDSVAPIVWLATLPEDGPTAGFFDENGPQPW